MKEIEKDEIIIYWINNKENQTRYNHMNALLEKYFPKNKKIHINAVMEEKKYNGVSIAHLNAVLKGLIQKKPFLVLEDDVNIDYTKKELNKIFPLKINDDISGVYFGISAWGNRKKWDLKNKSDKIVYTNEKIKMFKGAEAENYDELYVKINSMYCAHAILYIKKRYILETATTCMMGVISNKPHDVLLLELQNKYNIIGLRNPVFYQDLKLGGQQRTTRIKIKKQLKENDIENNNDKLLHNFE